VPEPHQASDSLARRRGCRRAPVVVRSGKFTEESLRQAGGEPDHVFDSIIEVVDALTS